MALTSPGVQVTVIDESFYTPAEPGTVPLIVVATAQDKTNGAGTNTASATTKANAGKAFKITSQRDLTDLFGIPFFEQTASSTPIHGSERNEYGLLAAYSLLGVSNAAFIVRADVDLDQLAAEVDAPGANPVNGKWWMDTQATTWGIQEWNSAAASTAGGQKFTNKVPLVLTDADSPSKIENNAPKTSVGQIGDYAVVFQTVGEAAAYTTANDLARIYYKSPGNGGVSAGGTPVDAGEWVLIGSNAWKASWPVAVSNTYSGTLSGTLFVNAQQITAGTLTQIANNINSPGIVGVTAKMLGNKLYIYSDGRSLGENTNVEVGDSALSADGQIKLENGTASWSTIGIDTGLYLSPKLQQSPHTDVPTYKRSDNPTSLQGYATGSVWIKTTEPNNGARWRAKQWSSATLSWVASEAPIYASTNAALYYLDRSGGGANISADTVFVQSNAQEHSGFDATPDTAEFRMWYRHIGIGQGTSITSNIIKSGTFTAASTRTFTLAESIVGQLALDAAKTITLSTAAGNAPTGDNSDADKFAAAINAAGFTNIEASVVQITLTQSRLVITHNDGGDFRLTDSTGNPLSTLFTPYNIKTRAGTENFYNISLGSGAAGAEDLAAGAAQDYLASGYQPLAAQDPRFSASPDAPLNEAADQQLWYNPNFADVDIMVHNGNTWVGYRHSTAPYFNQTDDTALTKRTGYLPIVAASNPYVSGVTVTGDLWISTADLENFPTIYRYNSNLTDIGDVTLRWELVDKTDQTTEEGVLFADARQGTSGGTATTAPSDDIADLITNNFLDPDAPDPALYPKGMLLWNLRRSGGNVKQYRNNYIDTATDNPRTSQSGGTNNGDPFVSGSGQTMESYYPDRWVTASGNNEDGSGSFGRKAQRKVVTQALKSVIDTSQEIRDEERRNFNIIACPGYPETMSNLVNLNIDRGITAFVIGDTPLRLPADATSLNNWGTNAELVTDNGDDGIVTYDEYLATYYPNGFTTDLSGSNAVVPASHMMLKTIALSDNVSFPWFAPAGTRRGGITNATAVGYIDAATGEFQTVALNEGQRDTLYELKVNPIPFFNGVGLVAYGQKTRARNASALDRINVARLVVYLRSQLNKLARPYLFEPNDKITRDEIKQAAESLLLELVGLRAIYDFAVVCDESNNTPSRIDRNELYVDIAIEPVKAIEFIYIPLRIKNTGEI
jgi:hypothetical protein